MTLQMAPQTEFLESASCALSTNNKPLRVEKDLNKSYTLGYGE